MQRGLRTFQTLIFTETPIATDEKRQSGRDRDLVERRNTLIAHRYYYHAKIIRRNYPDTMQALRDEFFLSDIQLSRIVSALSPLLHKLKHEAPNTKQLDKLYPHLVW